ncbi:myelin protein zero-like protein 3 [Poecilia formosa]|uniref:Myelin protein zero-like protein 3 n=1 Tax=Poecilia formosa TaxID=48698 RepID=A0A087XWG9_POEFO|nr:PREDICTED: myelin protein zero-like protein 3 [Poecilia formosa]XP_007576014.1 PREDICTED: myelin protein zero-like protein 3 [Poecilia formosa]
MDPPSTPIMCRVELRRTALNSVLLLYLFGVFGLSQVCSIEVTTPSELHATKGDTVRLPCTFTSTASPTSKMRVSWSYTPQTGGPALVFFHFLSKAELPKTGQFAGRIKWQGTPARGDVSIYLINATLNDNGTYICDVTNPPDVFGSPKSDTVLTVTPKPTTFRFSDVAVLMAFVLLPSGLITFFLVGRMLCPKKRHNQSKAYRSPIEVTEGEETGVYPQAAYIKSTTCCDMCLMDSDEEEEYYSMQKMHPREEEYVESQC